MNQNSNLNVKLAETPSLDADAPLPERVVLPIHPREYRRQPGSHCGCFAVNAVLSAYGLDDVREPWELHTHPLSRITGSSSSPDYYPSILRSYGLIARARSADGRSHPDKIDLLKRLLAEGNPVILSVGSFFDTKSGGWKELKGQIASHWISLWGYDDVARTFYIYDSLVNPELADDVPIGNKARTYDVLLRIWTGSQLSRLMFGKYSYILIKRP